MFSWNGCYSASSYVEAVSTRVNSEMAILAQRILMLWPVQNTCRQTLELIWNSSRINLESIWNMNNIILLLFVLPYHSSPLLVGWQAAGKGASSSQFVISQSVCDI